MLDLLKNFKTLNIKMLSTINFIVNTINKRYNEFKLIRELIKRPAIRTLIESIISPLKKTYFSL